MRLNGFRKNVPKCQTGTPSKEKGGRAGKGSPPSSRNDFCRVGREAVTKAKGACLEKICVLLGARGLDSQLLSSKKIF